MNNKHSPLVTIGIPTYNRADGYLKQALESALKQTYTNIEIVVSDNCSNDNTEAVVKGFADKRIRYFKQDVNIGVINNANFCLQQAQGAYFMQLHDDDMIDHDFIETCMKAANYSSDFGIIRTGTRVIDSDNNTIQEARNYAVGLSTTDFFRSWFACKTSIYLCSTLYNTNKVKEMGGFKQNLFDDVDAIVHLSKFGRVDVEEVKASFRKHSGEITFSAKIKDWCVDSLYVLDIICDLADNQQKKSFRREGLIFLSTINYGFASKIENPLKRIKAYFEIYKMFNYSQLPPPFRKFIMYMNPVYNLKLIVNRLKKALS